MALLRSCVFHRSLIKFPIYRQNLPSVSLLIPENDRLTSLGYGRQFIQRRNFSGASWQDSYNNFFKTITESNAVATIKNELVLFHDVSGLPWGWTIILTTFGLRALITFPLGVYQSYILAKLELVKQEFVPIVQELKRETAVAVKRFNLTEKVARTLYNASLKKQWRLLIERENCHPMKASLIVFIQLPMWILLSLSYRCMAFKLGQDPFQSCMIADQLSVEGIAWLSNLLLPDPTCILPLSVSLINLSIIELQAATKENHTRAQRIITNVFRTFAILSFPIALSVPSCMSLYWCISSGLALGQNVVLMSPSARRFFRIPHTPTQKDRPFQYAWDNFKAKCTFKMENFDGLCWQQCCLKTMAYGDDLTSSGFKKSFKLFKQKDGWKLSDLLDCDNEELLQNGKVLKYEVGGVVDNVFGVAPAVHWNAYSIKNRPGLILVRNPFTCLGQRYWTVRCLKDFPRKPNRRNVDIDKELGNLDDLWGYCHKHNIMLLDKLRWATLGYHHNWDTKIYSEELKSQFPADLALLGRHFASALGYPTFEAQSAIVNYYHSGSTLSGHVDSSEVDLNAPLLSFRFSFGQSAIFLIGGPTPEDEGIPLLLQSGDVLLMSKEARLCYHAVPRILASTTSPWTPPLSNEPPNSNEFNKLTIASLENELIWAPFGKYVSRSRINMNIRQVLPAGRTSLYETDAN